MNTHQVACAMNTHQVACVVHPAVHPAWYGGGPPAIHTGPPAIHAQACLHAACWQGDLNAVRHLIANGHDLNAPQPSDGATPLHIAISLRHRDIAVVLIENGAALDRGDINCNTPLHVACYCQNSHATRLLLKGGAVMDYCNNYGLTPLSVAVQLGHVEIVRLLLESGADLSKVRATYGPNAPAISGLLREFGEARRSQVQIELEAKIAQAKVRHVAEVTTTKDRHRTELAETKGRHGTELALLKSGHEAELAALKAGFQAEEEAKVDVARLKAELRRWRDGDLVCRRIFDVETGTEMATAVEATSDDNNNKENIFEQQQQQQQHQQQPRRRTKRLRAK